VCETRRSYWIPAVTVLFVLTLGSGAASAHEERESRFPEGEGEVPTYRTIEEADDVVVVCKPDSGERIADISDRDLRTFNEELLEECAFEHIQEAVFHIRDNGVQGTNLYVLPGLYLEEPSREAECAQADTESAVSGGSCRRLLDSLFSRVRYGS
jgi:hypothetical protein